MLSSSLSSLLLLLLLTFFNIRISYGETDTTVCVCESWIGNSSYVYSIGNVTIGCKSSFESYIICEINCSNNICECVSEKDNQECANIANIGKALAGWLIAVIVIASLCGLCIIISIIYCICAGALCCAAAAK